MLYNFSSVTIWQSFDSSTDILLPQQLLTFGTSLISNRGQGLYSSGYYKFFFDEDNALHLLFRCPKLSSLYWPDPSLEDISDAGICIYKTSRAALLDDTGYFWSSLIHAGFMASVDLMVCVLTIMSPAEDAFACKASR